MTTISLNGGKSLPRNCVSWLLPLQSRTTIKPLKPSSKPLRIGSPAYSAYQNIEQYLRMRLLEHLSWLVDLPPSVLGKLPNPQCSELVQRLQSWQGGLLRVK
jgi:hypothetical protein